MPPPPPPPRVPLGDDVAPRGDWRAKYASGGLGGRQQTCEFLASQWHMILKAMEGQLEAIGVKPIIPADALYGPMVLTLDQVLPPNVNMSPPQVACLGTTIITAQRFYHRKAIGAALAAQVAAGKPAPAPPPPPAPPPAPPVDPAPTTTPHLEEMREMLEKHLEPEPPAPPPPPEEQQAWDFTNERGEVVI